ncbi:unnamed protein product, partial [Brenthis ino]
MADRGEHNPTCCRESKSGSPRSRDYKPNFGDTQRSYSASTPPNSRRGHRGNNGRRRRNMTPFERATSEFVSIEEGRLRLEEMRINREHEREMARINVEYQINELLQKIADNIERWLMRGTT